MVAVYTGNGLGLFNTSLTQLGNAGGGRIGQGATSQYVNLATGNLVLQDLDESLLVRGLGIGLLRTYNSRGTVAGQGQDGWVTGYERNLTLSGTLNTAGSTMVLAIGDGQTVTFAWSGTQNLYVTTAGDGANDTLRWDAATSTWTLVEGSTRREEQFANHDDVVLRGRLQRIRDLRSDGASPVQYDVLYDAVGRVSEVRSVDGAGNAADAIVFGYNLAGQLATIQTRENGVLKSQVSYGYEFANGSGRLTWVQTDLTPHNAADNTWDAANPANNDGRLFRTSYTYASAAAGDLRIASVATSDGVSVSYTYESDGVGGFRVTSVVLGGGPDSPQQTTTFVYGKNATDVIDGNGRVWTYQYDADRRLTAVLDPAVGGLRRKTEYQYDGAGKVIGILESSYAGAAPGLKTTFQYDANGNRILQQDLLGNTVAWAYNAANQVISETRYIVPATIPVGKGMYVPPSGELTRHFVYDNRDRLRFEIDATGAVRELTYATGGNGIGQVASERHYLGSIYSGPFDEASLLAWATDAGNKRRANSALTFYGYDIKGRLAQQVNYATVSDDANGNGVLDDATAIVNHVYDAQGLLRQKITVHGPGRTVGGAPPANSEVVDYVYDGMGRLLSALSRNASTSAMPDPRIDPAGHAAWLAANDATTLLTTYAYADSGRQIWTTHDSGMIRLDQYNRTGQLGITTEFGGENRYTYNYYDQRGQLRARREASGGTSYFFYDDAGRLTGTVDETGAVVETRYNDIGQPIAVVAYAIGVDTTDWFAQVKGAATFVVKDRLLFSVDPPAMGASDVWVQIDAVNDRRVHRSYDGAGRLETETDGIGLVTTYRYDGASRLLSTTIAKPGDASVSPRTTRLFHDDAGRVLATLDPEGYLVETVYDAFGRAAKTVRYATITVAAYRENGSLQQLRPAAAAGDQVTRLFYNARNQQIGMLDAEGYLTEFIYDETNNQRAVKAYAKRLTGLNGSESFGALRTAATTNPPIEPFRLTQRSYNALGQLTVELNHEGTVTRFTYDDAGRLVKTAATAATSEIREGNARYDVFGNLIGELGGEGSTRLLPGMTEPQIDAIYAQYGVRHSYDTMGRRIESIDAAGNKTWYFYDDAGRQTFVVRGVHDGNNIQNAQGEVVETRYNAFGDVVDSIAYTGRITLANAGSRASAQQAISALAIGGTDSRVQLRYDIRGLLAERIDAEGYRTLFGYTAFGELRTQQDLESDGSVRRTLTNSYDKRGLLTGQTETGGVLTRSTSSLLDAFGRAYNRTDARGNTTTIGYDRLGRVVSQTANNVSGRNETVTMSYDAFGRTVEVTDALGRTTGYVHSDNARSVVMTTPEGVRITTVDNGFGQTLTVSQTLPDGTVATTTTTYDKDGRVLDVTDPLGRVDHREYDARGLLVATMDGSDRRVEYRYDAAGRVLKRIEDPNGLALTTTTTYDGQGRALGIVDASGRETRMTYDRKGNLVKTILAPSGIYLQTTYTWDRDGRQLTVTEGAETPSARTIAYGYDNFGRRISETLAPGTLDLVTTYAYDANDNVVRRTDASGRVVRYAYDAVNRLRFSVDDKGGITEYAYDAAGREKMARVYAAPANIAGLSAMPGESDIAGLILNQSLRNDAKDETRFSIHDRDGRLILSVDGDGGVIAYGYDSAGRATTERRHIQKATLTAVLRDSLRAGTATVAEVGVAADAKDMQVRHIYDAAGQAVFTVDAFGAVERTYYDRAGRAVARVRHATAIDPSTIGNGTSAAQLAAMVTDSAADRVEYFVHDAAGRVRYTLDGSGALSQTDYDGAGRVVQARAFDVSMPVTSTLRARLLAGTASEADFSAFATANEATARAEYRVYDPAGRMRYSVVRYAVGAGAVTEFGYDASGLVVSRLQYLITIPFDPTDTTYELFNVLSSTEARTTKYFYDGAGRQRFVLDATGALTETRYDGAGRVTDTIAYGNRPPGVPVTTDELAAWTGTQAAADIRRARSVYDAAGRVYQDIDAANVAETYLYDGAGRLTTRTDRNNNIWTYEYDAGGRLAAEYSPSVRVATIGANGLPSSENRSILTRYAYDGVGNLVSKTENANAPSMSERRTTVYEYDSRGHQVRTIFVDPGAIDPASGQILDTGIQPTIEVLYDALGQAVVQKDVRGHYSYRVYDKQGRLAYEIDQERQVTTYAYNVFGEQTQVRRHANGLGNIIGWSAGQAISLAQMQSQGQPAPSVDDRAIFTQYDLRGLKTKVELTSVGYRTGSGTDATGTPTTTYGYNIYGDLVTESVLLEGVAGSGTEQWATAYRYYDALGRNTLTVDALGYVTETRYNATGEASETIEYARALSGTPNVGVRPSPPAPGDASIGQDRITRWTYDAVGRKLTETSVRQYGRTDGSTGSRDVTSVFGYDGGGRLTSISDDTGTTITRYDALGRTLSVEEPVRAVVVQGLDTALGASTSSDLTTAHVYEQRSPYTEMAYDAFGNAVEVRRYANGKPPTQAATADDSRDQVVRTRYDRQGRAVWTRDGEGAIATRSYDAADNLTGVRYTLKGNDSRNAVVSVVNTYDKTGRQLTTTTTRERFSNGVSQGSVVDTGEVVTYNAFGEIATKTLHGLDGTLVYRYDAAGRLIASNESGAFRNFGYNLAGHQVYASQKAYLETVNSVDTVVDAVTITRVDKLGRAVRVTLPSHTTDTSASSTMTQTVDRWGNVLRIVDTRGYQTDYEYNSLNQLVREIRPLTKVVHENGGAEWRRPENRRYYDALGRLVATRDANGNLRTTEYDAAGRMVASKDAYGNATRFAYDALGNQRATQNPLGYLTYKEYDRAGRVVRIGDYLPNANGSTRDKATLQRYVLNENGDRIEVFNASSSVGAKYDYDSRGQLIRSQTQMGVVMEYAYDVAARKILERNALSMVDNAPTYTDRDNETVRRDESSWNYDVFGRLIDHNNLSGRDSNYVYNAESAQLRQESGEGGLTADNQVVAPSADKRISYYANGRIREVIEGASRYSYEYDAAGNKIVEQVTTTDAYGATVRTRTLATFDSHNRVERVVQEELNDQGVVTKRIFDLLTEYDANGNRRHVRAASGYGPNVDGIPIVNNRPVVVGTIESRTVRKGMVSEFGLLPTDIFRDAEQNPLGYTVAQSNGSALPPWLTLTQDPVTKELRFVANPPANLADQDIVVRLTAYETGNVANSVSVDFTVRVRTNSAPQLVQAGDVSLRAKTYQPWSKDLVASDYFRDPDVQDQLTLSLVDALPAGLSADTSSPGIVRLSGTPTVSGTYVLHLRATDQLGASVVKRFVVTVAPNAAPTVVAAQAPTDAIIGRQFEWSRDLAQVFSDPDGDRLQVTTRRLGGGALPAWMSFQYLYDQATPQIVFSGNVPTSEVNGQFYDIELIATDVDGVSVATTLRVNVFANRAPVATAGTQTMSLRQLDNFSQTFPLSALFSDAEGDALNLSTVWPEGSPLPGWLKMTVDRVAKTVTFSKIQSTTPVVGTFAFSVRAADIAGLTATKNFSITVGADNAPVRTSVPLPDTTLVTNRAFSYTLPEGLFTDPDNDPLTLVAHWVVQEREPAPGGTFLWTVDVRPLPDWMTFNPATRTLSGFVPATQTEAMHIRIQATDGRLTSAASNQFVGAANVNGDSDIRIAFQQGSSNGAPVYNSGSLVNQTVQTGQSFSYTVPGNAFTDPNGDTLTYTADANGGAWPSWLAFDAVNRRFTGTPTGSGSWTIRVIASDGTASAVGTFVIATANGGPVYNGTLPPRTAPVNTAVSWPLPVGTFTDPNGDPLSYTLEVEQPGYFELVYIVQDDAWEPVWVDPVWVAASGVGLSIAANGTISGTIGGLYSRADDTVDNFGNLIQHYQTTYDYRLRITARDSGNLTASGIFAASANVAPQAPNIGTLTMRHGAISSLTLPAFIDANENALGYSIANLPPGLNFDAATRTISGSPSDTGSWIVGYTANDGNGGVSSTLFTLTVVANRVPIAPSVSAQTGTINVGLTMTLPEFTDADFDALTYSVAGLPPGLDFNPATRVVSGTPTATGPWAVTYTANDGYGGTASVSFNFTIGSTPPPNRPPEVNRPLDDQWGFVDQNFDYTFPTDTFTDPDNNPLSYTATLSNGNPLPSWLFFNGTTRTFWGTPPGPSTQSWTIRVRASDGLGGFAQDDFVLHAENNSLIVDGGSGDDGSIGIDPAGTDNTSTDDGKVDDSGMETGLVVGEDKGSEILPVEIPPVMEALTTNIPSQVKEEWFVYDAENRLKLVGGQLVGVAGAQGTYIGLGPNGAESYGLMYDAAGQVVGRYVKNGVNELVYRTTYDLRGRKQYEYHAEYLNPVSFEFGGISKMYRYDALNQLEQTHSYYQNGTEIAAPTIGGEPGGMPMSVAGWLSGAEVYQYDGDGRLVRQETRTRRNGLQGIQWRDPGSPNYYNELQQRTDISVLAIQNAVDYRDAGGNSGYDALGRVRVYRYSANDFVSATQTVSYTHTFLSTYEGWETYQEKTVSGSSSDTDYKPTTNTLTYDAFGRLSKQVEHTEYDTEIDDRVRAYSYNGDGRVQTRREGTIHNNGFTQTPDTTGARNNYLFVHAAGQQQAELREGGQVRNSHYTYNTPQIQTLNGRGNYAAGGGTVVALQGETLQSLAQRVYGNSSLWYVLADANGMSDPNAELVAGTQFNTPRVNVSSNDANTFKPYNPAEAIGPTSPGLPFITPPPKQNCNALATILIVIVAVVVTVYTAGAAASAFGATGTVGAGTATAGAAAGTVGAAATGATITGAVTTGVVASTGVGAIGTAALAGGALVGSIGAVGIAGAAFIGGVAGSIASQLVGKALGVVDSFNLRSAVASGFSSVLTAGTSGSGVIGKLAGNGKYANVASGALSGAAGTITSYAANRLAGLDAQFSWRSIAANAVGGAISAGLTPGFDQNATGWRALRNDMIGGSISRVIGLHTRRAFGFDDRVDYGGMLADAFGNVLGNATLKRLARYETERELLSGLAPDQRAVVSKALKNGASPEEAMEVLKAMGMGVGSPETYAYGEGPPAEQLILETVQGPQDFDPYQMWRDDFAALRTGSGLINGKGYNLGTVHNDLVDYGIALVDLFESFSFGSDNPILMDSIEAAVRDRDADNAILRAARLDPYDLQGLSIERMRSEVLGGLAGSIQSTYRLAQATRVVVSQPMAFMRMGGLYNFLSAMAEGGESLGRTTLAGNLASAAPLLGLAVSGLQMYALNADIEDLNIMAEIGLISPSAHRRAISDAKYEQAETGVSAGLGGVPGKVGKVLQTLFFAATSSDAEAGQASSRFGRSVAATGRSGATLVRRFADDLKGTHLSSTKYGNIPAEHRWRYDRYLQESKSSAKLSPELWYKKAQIVWANNAGGNAFERQVREALGSPMGKGSKPLAIGGHIPDLPVGRKFGVTDVKNVEYLTSSSQLDAFYEYARTNSLKFNLVVGPRTNAISAPLLDHVRSTGGRVTLFNPSTGKFSRIAIGASGPWSR